MNIGRSALLTVLASASIFAQRPVEAISVFATGPKAERHRHLQELAARKGKLTITVTMDRTEYLPGEAAEFTIEIANLTASPIETYEPFNGSSGQMLIAYQKGSRNYMEPDYCYCVEPDAFPKRVFLSGEKMQVTLDASNYHSDSRWADVQMPTLPDNYKLFYTYGGTAANFRVLPVKVGVSTIVPLMRPGQPRPALGEKRPFLRRVGIAAVDADGKHYIIASRNTEGDPRILRKPDGTAASGPESLGPFLRITESDQPIVELSGVADADENITVSWTTADGRHWTTLIDPDRKVKH